MAFQTKNFISIVAGALNMMRGGTDKITDFRPGSVARTLIEGPAIEIEQLYQQMFIGLREAIPVATFLSFGFEKTPASAARGFVTVSRTLPDINPMTIPTGTLFRSTDGRQYLSTESVIWQATDLTVDVPVVSSVLGLSGNISAGGVALSDFFAGMDVSITNNPITNGRDEETDAEREARFADFIQSLSRGTVAAIRYAASQAVLLDANAQVSEYVTRVGMLENPGYVRLFIYSSMGDPTSELIARCQQIIDGYVDENGRKIAGFRSAGVRVQVFAMTEVEVDFAAAVEMMPGYTLTQDVINKIIDAVTEEIDAVESGETLYIGTLVDRVIGIAGVLRCVTNSSENIICGENEVLVPGAISITSL